MSIRYTEVAEDGEVLNEIICDNDWNLDHEFTETPLTSDWFDIISEINKRKTIAVIFDSPEEYD